MRPLLAAFALIVTVTAIGCSRRESDAGDNGARGGQAIDVDLMAFLSEARALHHQANLKEEAGDLPGAAAAIDRLVQARRPGDGRAPEVQEVLADAYARLAELELRLHALDRASEAVKNGLAHAPEPTYFRGHLLEVQGLVDGARAAELADAGRPEEAARLREKAIAVLEEVVKIQDQVIQRSLAARDAEATKDGGK